MGQISSNVGLVSGIDYGKIIDQLIQVDAKPRTLVQQRNKTLQTKQTALQAISAKLLAVKNAANTFSSDKAFNQTTAASSDPSVLTASSDTGATPGSYSFRVARLVSAQQSISRGFADATSTPIGPGTLRFEPGEARLDAATKLAGLNGGGGFSRGSVRITDGSGATAAVDLSDAVTVNDVVDKLNAASGVSVVAGVEGDHLTLRDASGAGGGALSVSNVGTSDTATSLGLAKTASGGAITGDQINRVGDQTLLATLNDGIGVRGNGAANDLSVTTGSGTYAVNVDGATTLGDLAQRLEDASGGNVTLQANDRGTGVRIVDTAGTGSLSVAALNGSKALGDLGLSGAAASGDQISGSRVIASINSKLLKNLEGGRGLAAFGGASTLPLSPDTPLSDLGALQGASTDGGAGADLNITAKDDPGATYGIDFDGLSTVGDLINAVSAHSGGKVTASVEGNKLRFTDTTGGDNPLTLANAGGSDVADKLGLAGDFTAASVLSADTDPQTPAGAGATLAITDSTGASANVDLSGAQSVSDILATINQSGVGVKASLNQAGNGIALTDTAGGAGSLSVDDADGVLAQQLGLKGDFDQTDQGRDLRLQYITGGTTLDSLGVQRGKFTVRDSSGSTATVDLTQGNETTLQDVISEINSRGLAVHARVNDSGDGLLIEDRGPGTVAVKVTDAGSTTAADLGLAGVADAPGANLDASLAKTVQVGAGDTLRDVANKINSAGLGVNAGIINDGSAGAPYRLSLAAKTAGTDGAFVFDDGGLGLGVSTLAHAQDAAVFYGSSDPAKAVAITSKSNTLKNIIPGATLHLKAAGDQPVQVSIGRDDQSVSSSVSDFVKAFNDAVKTIDKYDSYDAKNKKKGPLLGNATVGAIRNQLFTAVTSANPALTGQYKALSQVGVTVNKDGRLQFDKAKLGAALQQDPQGVNNLFTFQQFATDEAGKKTDKVLARGVGVEINNLLKDITDPTTGKVQGAVDRLQTQIDHNKDRIDTLTDRLKDKRARLQKQFIHMESALAKLQSQQSALGRLASAAASSGSSLSSLAAKS